MGKFRMTHKMKLQPLPFSAIVSGRKTIEMRLFDEKRRNIRVGDHIVFTNMENAEESIIVKVANLYEFSSFSELYQNIPLEKLGYQPDEIPFASYKDMEKYYPQEKQRKFGVLGIEIELL